MKNFALYLFDLDDSLIDTSNSYLTAYQKTFTKIISKKIPFSEIHSLCRLFGSGDPKKIFSTLLQLYYQKKTYSLIEIEKMFWDSFWEKIQLFPDVKNYLELLQKKKKKMAIVSNGNAAIQKKKIKKVGLDAFFSAERLYLSSTFGKKNEKPSPFMIKKAMEKERVSPSQTVFFGDADRDILAGKLAGITTVHIQKKIFIKRQVYFQADYSCHDWREAVKKIS